MKAEGRRQDSRLSSLPPPLEERTLAYGTRAVALYRHLCRQERAARRLADQFLRAATSVGANLAEGRSGETRRDFIHKHSIALKEAREALYWLRLFVRADLVEEGRVASLMDETDQLIAILVTIITRAKRNGTVRTANGR
ncbi:MAG: four helix bundle protein [Bacteroidota bacterium]